MLKMIMRLDVDDTIVAIASARGPAWRGVLRFSGGDIFDVLQRLIDFRCLRLPDARDWLQISKPTSIAAQLFLDELFVCEAEIIVWPNHSSFTRQPCAELHMLGATPILEKVLDLCVENGCRLAMPGEFTMRAFLSGRLDLTQAEAVLGLIDARNERQFETSLGQLAGGIGGPIKEIKESLIYVLAEIEAGLDFVDEDIEFVSDEQVLTSLNEVHRKLEAAIRQLRQRQAAQDEVTVVFAGEPNAGKSSLFNCLSEGQAIVSDVPGTTRDYLTAVVQWNGMKFRLIDTAGLELTIETKEAVELQMEGQTKIRMKDADIVLLCLDQGKLSPALEAVIADYPAETVLVVNTKADLVSADERREGIWVSVQSREGIGQLQNEVLTMADAADFHQTGVSATAVRVADSLSQALNCLAAAKLAAESGQGEELIAAEIRNALEQLGIVVGTVYTDDILDVVFSQFCIGK